MLDWVLSPSPGFGKEMTHLIEGDVNLVMEIFLVGKMSNSLAVR